MKDEGNIKVIFVDIAIFLMFCYTFGFVKMLINK